MVSAKRILTGSGSNVLRLVCTSAAALVLPPLLTRSLPADSYSAWVTLLQLSTYVALLDVGLQTVVAKFIAQHHAQGEFARASDVLRSATRLLWVGAALGAVLVVVAVVAVPVLFPGMPVRLHGEVRTALLIVGFSSALLLPFGPFLSVFVGLQRYTVPTVVVVASRLLSAILILLGAALGRGLVPLAVAVAVANLTTVLAQYVAWRLLALPALANEPGRADRGLMGTLLSTGSIFALWSLGGLLVSGLDTIIVGHFSFVAVGAYAIAATIANFMGSLLFGIFGPLMPAAAALHGEDVAGRSARLLVQSTRYSTLAILLLAVPLAILAYPILFLWVGPSYADGAALVLRLLILGNAIRQLGYAYSLIVVARGRQRPATIATMSEAVVNLSASIALAGSLGAVGVALGTVIGAAVSVMLHLIVSMHYTADAIPVSRRRLVRDGVIGPLVSFAPVLALVPFFDGYAVLPAPPLLIGLLGAATVAAIVVIALTREDRAMVRRVVRSRIVSAGSAPI